MAKEKTPGFSGMSHQGGSKKRISDSHKLTAARKAKEKAKKSKGSKR